MKDIDDWAYILDHTDALFYRLAVGIASRADISLVDSHEGMWTAFEQGQFKLLCGDDDSVGVLPCETDNDRRAAIDQNKPLVSYRQRVIEQEVDAGLSSCNANNCHALHRHIAGHRAGLQSRGPWGDARTKITHRRGYMSSSARNPLLLVSSSSICNVDDRAGSWGNGPHSRVVHGWGIAMHYPICN